MGGGRKRNANRTKGPKAKRAKITIDIGRIEMLASDDDAGDSDDGYGSYSDSESEYDPNDALFVQFTLPPFDLPPEAFPPNLSEHDHASASPSLPANDALPATPANDGLPADGLPAINDLPENGGLPETPVNDNLPANDSTVMKNDGSICSDTGLARNSYQQGFSSPLTEVSYHPQSSPSPKPSSKPQTISPIDIDIDPFLVDPGASRTPPLIQRERRTSTA